MISPFYEDAAWSGAADEEYTISELFAALPTLVTKAGSEHPHKLSLQDLYEKHGELINEIALGYEKLLIPAYISDVDTDENILFTIIHAIRYIDWYQNINTIGYRNYKKEFEKVTEARLYIQRYSKERIVLDFPQHQNDTIRELETFMGKTKTTQKIRDYFKIKTANVTNETKLQASFNKFISKNFKEISS